MKEEIQEEPKPIDARNRSLQKFCMQLVATILAVLAPPVVEVVKRVLGSETARGVATLGQAFNATRLFKVFKCG